MKNDVCKDDCKGNRWKAINEFADHWKWYYHFGCEQKNPKYTAPLVKAYYKNIGHSQLYSNKTETGIWNKCEKLFQNLFKLWCK